MTKELEERLTALEQELHYYKSTSLPQPAKHKKGRHRLTVAVASIVILALPSIYFVYKSTQPQGVQLPAAIQKQSSVLLYVPKPLPAGWSLEKESVRAESGIVYYSLRKDTAQVVITTQPKPQTFDYGSFYAKGLPGSSPISTRLGQGATGEVSGQPVGSLLIGDSWILASSSSSKVKRGDIEDILQSLAPAKK